MVVAADAVVVVVAAAAAAVGIHPLLIGYDSILVWGTYTIHPEVSHVYPPSSSAPGLSMNIMIAPVLVIIPHPWFLPRILNLNLWMD